MHYGTAAFSTLFLLSVVAAAPGSSQLTPVVSDPRRCGTVDLINEEVERTIAPLVASRKTAFRAAKGLSKIALKNVQIHFHVIQRGDAVSDGALSDEAIAGQIAATNTHYKPYGYHFTLATIDRTVNADWFSSVAPSTPQQDAMKALLRQGDGAALNLYTTGFESGSARGLLGFSTYPYSYFFNNRDDGVVFLHSTVPGGALNHYNEGKTMTHEIGHWLGLYHVFQGGCLSLDGVADTAPEASPASGCPVGRESCGSLDPITNYMDYSYDSCMDSFTEGQMGRMSAMTWFYRGI